MKNVWKKIALIFVLVSIPISYSECPLQSHPLSEICPIDVNLNMYEFNITNVFYLFANDIVASGKVVASALCIGNDCIGSFGMLSGPWTNTTTFIYIREGYPLNVNISNILFINYTSGNVGIGTFNPPYKLYVSGDVGWSGKLLSGSVPWQRLTDFPSSCSCPSGYALQVIGSECVCVQINSTPGVVNGSGVANYIPIWTSSNSLGISNIQQINGITIFGGNIDLNNNNIFGVKWLNASYVNVSNDVYVGGKIGINTLNPSYNLDIFGSFRTYNVGKFEIDMSGTIKIGV